MSANGFENFLGKTLTKRDIEEKLNDDELDRLAETLLLSPDAKRFGVARELTIGNNFLLASLDKFVDLFAISAAYWYSYSTTRIHKLQFKQRRLVYFKAIVSALFLISGSRFFIQHVVDKSIDTGWIIYFFCFESCSKLNLNN